MPNRDLINNYWNLSKMPFEDDYLDHNNKNFFKLFVNTESVAGINELFPTILSEEKKLLILGERSSGKTTLLNYLFQKLLKLNLEMVTEKPIFPMMVSPLKPAVFKSCDELSSHFYRVLRDSMRDSLNNAKINPQRDSFVDIITELKQKGDDDDIINQIIIASERIKELCSKNILLIDDFDKTSEKHPDVVEDFFSGIQPFVEKKLWPNNIFIVFVGPAFWIGLGHGGAEFAWITGSPFQIKKWKYEEIHTLISKRLETFTTMHNYSLNRYFTEDAIRYIYNSTNGNPRYCLNAAKQCIKQGWAEKSTKINLNFLQNHQFCVREAIECNEIINYISLEKTINGNKNILAGYNKLGSFFKENTGLSISLIDDIMLAYNNKMRAYSHREISNFNLLLKSHIIDFRKDEKKNDERVIQLDPQIIKLLDLLNEEFGGDDRIRNFIIHQFGI